MSRLRAVHALALLLALAARAHPQEDAPEPPPARPAAERTPLPAPRFVGPRTGPEREKALQRGGGSAQTERAVEAALDWLARHARPEGGWDADGFPERCDPEGTACDGVGKGQHGEEIPCPFDAAITAVATLAFLGDGHLPGAEGDPYGALVAAALESLRGSGGDTWALPLATQCFAEAEALERRGRFRDDVDAGVRALLAKRQEDGAWGYAAPWRPGSDVPYSALCVTALVTARDAGARLPDDLAPGVERWLATLECDEKGRVAYLVNGRDYGYTPTSSNAHDAAAIRELLRVGLEGAGHRRTLDLVAKQKPVWKISFREVTIDGRKVRVQTGNLSMYQWWYGTLASAQEGGSMWSAWYGKLKTALGGHQETSGCARGSWEPLGTYERQTGGRVFATALGALMLEEPYAHRRIE